MASKYLQRLTLAAVLIGGLGLLDAQSAAATRPVRRTARPEAARGFNLFAGAVNVMMNTNRIQCNINNIGEQCVDPTNSSVVGGGYWPKGTPDQYIFNGGLQVSAIIPGTRANFAWSGDTVGAFFFDPRGDQAAGQGLTNVFNALNATDLAEWPSAAYVNDPTLFNAALLGRKTISQQDTYVRYWDGSVSLLTGRQHPMGLLVDQRALMWNFPSGNQDIMYFLIRFINITANDATRYAGLSAYGYSASDIADIVQIGRNFRAASQSQFNVTIPDTGYAFANMYAGYGQDPDEGSSGVNYSTANLPFAMGFVYKANMSEPTWSYPANTFGTPFAPAPGMEGVKYLKSPTNPATGRPFGITMFTNTTNGGAFPDRFGVQAMWRLASNNLQAQDGSCNAPRGTPLCQLVQTYADTRFYMYSGPMTIKPGESAVIVVAMVHAAPIAAAIATDGAAHPLGNSSYDMKPGNPGTPTGFISATSRTGQTSRDTVRLIDRATGWNSATADVSALDVNADGFLDQSEIPTIPRSLLNKSLVAQAVFNANFLLPFAPEGPSFFLVPGDNQVTVVWQPSATESVGDPYFAVASDPLNSLYDPNFRRYDVEGYRIWRGRTEAEMQIMASFDYAGTAITDRTGGFFYSSNPQCAPELGLAANCPVAFVTAGTGPTYAYPLTGAVVQIPAGGRTKLSDGSVLILNADTAVTGGNSGMPGLTDSGVPFAYTDASARNGFRYFYAVTAFDINSVNSGPSSLESALNTKQATPRAASGQEAVGTLASAALIGADGNALDVTQAAPTLNATTGIFSGPQPPTNGAVLGFAAFLPQLLQSGNVTVTIDSIVPGAWLQLDYANAAIPARYYFTGQGAGAPVKFTIDIAGGQTGGTTIVTNSNAFLATSLDSALAARFGGSQHYSLYGNLQISAPPIYRLTQKSRANVNSDPAGPENGPRWWAGAANENTNNPNGITCVANGGAYTCALADLSRNAGAISGVGIFNIISYNTVASSSPARDIEGVTSSVFRAADFKWYWGANGAVDSVVDVTHHVRVPFSPKIRASWGILNDSSFVGVVNKQSMADTSINRVTWSDYACTAPLPSYFGICGGAANWPAGVGGAIFQNHARLNADNFASSSYAGTAALSGAAATGTGFIVYLAGNFFLMQVAALPATGTVWNMRTYAGNIAGNAGSFVFNGVVRPAAVPGLRFRVAYTGSTLSAATTTDSGLARVHTVPDPYYVTNALEITANTKVLRFVNLPSQAIIRIYSVSGILVNVLTHNDAGGGGEEVWNLRNRNNQFVASGVYFYHVETPDGRTKIGRLTVVNYAQ